MESEAFPGRPWRYFHQHEVLSVASSDDLHRVLYPVGHGISANRRAQIWGL